MTGIEVRIAHSSLVLRRMTSSKQPGPYDRIWKSDHLIPPELRDALLAAVSPLESVPSEQKDWHPGSNEQVLDLVHPSLYPIVYGRTISKGPPVEVIEAPEEESYAISHKFQWLPSDFAVSQDGKVSLSSPYINNVHPIRERQLYEVIPALLQRAIPLFERVLSDLRRPLLPWRIESTTERDYMADFDAVTAPCVWKKIGYRPSPTEEEEAQFQTDGDRDRWYSNHPEKLNPEVKGPYAGDLEQVKNTVYLNGTTIQCIIKLANIVLTPENPSYAGGKWHVEGNSQFAICATI